MVSSNSFTTTRLCQNYKPNCGTKNIKYIKMASNKNEQNSAPRDLKRTNCTINLPLVFTSLVYFVIVLQRGETIVQFILVKSMKLGSIVVFNLVNISGYRTKIFFPRWPPFSKWPPTLSEIPNKYIKNVKV